MGRRVATYSFLFGSKSHQTRVGVAAVPYDRYRRKVPVSMQLPKLTGISPVAYVAQYHGGTTPARYKYYSWCLGS